MTWNGDGLRDKYLAPKWDGDVLDFDVLLVGPTDCESLRKTVVVALHDRSTSYGSKVRYALHKWEDLPLSASTAQQDIERILAGRTFQLVIAVADQRIGGYSIRELDHFLELPEPRPRVLICHSKFNSPELNSAQLDERSALLRYFEQVKQKHQGHVYVFDGSDELGVLLQKLLAGHEQDERQARAMLVPAGKPDVAATPSATPPAPLDPYPVFVGLRPFGRKDAKHFFGREKEIDEYLQVIQAPGNQTLLVKGGSGAGKSSLILAGVLPRLPGTPEANPRNYLFFHPGADPFLELLTVINKRRESGRQDGKRAVEQWADRLSADPREFVRVIEEAIVGGGKRVLYIDQLEELLIETEASETDIGRRSEERKRAFVEGLQAFLAHDERRNFVLATIRSDYAEKLDGEGAAELHRLFERGRMRWLHAPEHDADIDRIVLGPCERAKFDVDPLLLKALRADIRPLRGWPPLLSACLEEMVWSVRADPAAMAARRLTREQYIAVGGLRDIVRRRAESFETELPTESLRLLPELFKRLVRIDRDTALPTKQRFVLSSLPADLRAVANLMRTQEHRLLADEDGDHGMVELIHDTLLERWPRLKNWIDGNRESLLDQHDFEVRASIWRQLGQARRKAARVDDLTDTLGHMREGAIWAAEAAPVVKRWVDASREEWMFEHFAQIADPEVWRLQKLAEAGVRLDEDRIRLLGDGIAPFYFVLCPESMPAPPAAAADAQPAEAASDDVRSQFAATQLPAPEVEASPFAYLNAAQLALRLGRFAQYRLHHVAALGGHVDVLERLRELGSQFDELSAHGRSAVGMAVLGGHAEAVAYLLARSTDSVRAVLSTTHDKLRHSFHDAAFAGHPGILQMLLDAVPATLAVDTPDQDGWTPLLIASQLGNFEFACTLIDSGRADLDARTEAGHGVLATAIAAARWTFVRRLLAHCDPARLMLDRGTFDDHNAGTPLYLLVSAWAETMDPGQRDEIEEITQRLLALGANPDIRIGEKGSPLVACAAEKGAMPIMEFLMPHVDLDATDSNGLSALHFALLNRHEPCAMRLLRSGRQTAGFGTGRSVLADALDGGLFDAARAIVERDDGIELKRLGMRALLTRLQTRPGDDDAKAEVYSADRWQQMQRDEARDLILARGRIVAMLLDHGLAAPRLHAFLRDPAERIVGVEPRLERLQEWAWPARPWPLEPLIDGDWQPVPAAECAGMLAECVEQLALSPAELEHLGDHQARRLALGFYENGSLVEFAARKPDGADGGIFELLRVGEQWVRLQGISPPLHEINAKAPLSLRHAEDAATYLGLFSAAVHGDEGAFRLLDRFDRVSWLPDADLASVANVESLCRPVRPVAPPEGDERFFFECHVFYGAAVFAAKMAVQHSGMVEMLEDTPLVSDLRVRKEKFVDGIRQMVGASSGTREDAERARAEATRTLAAHAWPHGEWPLPPFIGGQWRPVEAAEAIALLEHCLAQNTLTADDIRQLKDQRGRQLDLDLYGGGSLVEFVARSAAGEGTFALLRAGSLWARLQGESHILHRINRVVSPDIVDAQRAATYLALFGAAIQSEGGVFRQLDTAERFAWLPDAKSDRPDVDAFIGVPQPVPNADNAEAFVFRCHLLHGTAVFDATMAVDRSGTVKMLNDDAVLEDLDVFTERYLDGVRLLTHGVIPKKDDAAPPPTTPP